MSPTSHLGACQRSRIAAEASVLVGADSLQKAAKTARTVPRRTPSSRPLATKMPNLGRDRGHRFAACLGAAAERIWDSSRVEVTLSRFWRQK